MEMIAHSITASNAVKVIEHQSTPSDQSDERIQYASVNLE